MPSIMKRSLFRFKRNRSAAVTQAKSMDSAASGADRSALPVDPADASTASHASSNDQYFQSQSRLGEASVSSLRMADNGDYGMSTAESAAWTDPMTATEAGRGRRDAASAVSTVASTQTNLRSRQGTNCETRSREGIPIVTSSGSDFFSPSAVGSRVNYATDGFYSKSKSTYRGKERPKVRPTAKNSAFGGAPRYDWMDIETTAAIKIQANFRRVQTQNRLDELGLSTPGMRNRRAQRQARYKSRMSRQVASADVPFPFNLCGVGLLFGDNTFEDEKVVDSLEKKRADRKKEAYEREDVEKRRFRMRKKDSQHLEEGIEVVENFEGGELREEEKPSRRGLSLSLRKFR